MVALVVDLAFQIAGQEVVFQQNPVLHGLVPSIAGRRLQRNLPRGFDFALGLRMVWRTTNVVHGYGMEIVDEIGRHVGRAVVA